MKAKKEKALWIYRCQSCGNTWKNYLTPKPKCPNCGSIDVLRKKYTWRL